MQKSLSFSQRHFSRFLSVVVVLLLITSYGATPASAQTQAWSEGVGLCTRNGVATIKGIQCLVGNILSVAVSGIGLIGFVMMLVGAFKYMLSGDNSKGAEAGRNTITFAVVGLVVALSAVIILQLIAAFTGVKVILNFQVPG